MNSQHGLGLFGVLAIVAIAAMIAYYAFLGVTGRSDEVPTCRAELSACLTDCRRTTTEAADAQRCQQACQRDADACERGGG
jgi:Tfp pilus assembly protein FimT